MNSIKKRFGARIKEIRENKGLNQEQLAELVGMESRHISRIETGKSFTTLENIEKLAKALDVEMDKLFSFSHKNDRDYLVNEIKEYIDLASAEKVELIYKIINNVFN